MTPEQFTDAVDTIGWTLRHVAELLEVPHRRVQRWALGEGPDVPVEVARWLQALASAHRKHPVPRLSD
jgi:hypothetical protein